MAKSFNFGEAPGHQIRRAHQLSVAIVMEETAAFDVTPVQFAILNALMDDPGEDQITLAGRVAFDAATSGSVISRLEAKGWVRREADPGDKRRKLLWVTPEGEKVALQMKRAVSRVQSRLLGPLDEPERTQFGALLGKLVFGALALLVGLFVHAGGGLESLVARCTHLRQLGQAQEEDLAVIPEGKAVGPGDRELGCELARRHETAGQRQCAGAQHRYGAQANGRHHRHDNPPLIARF